jgi:8-oxo-dGTP pyrophosphatase MutT (NUDIX family)
MTLQQRACMPRPRCRAAVHHSRARLQDRKLGALQRACSGMPRVRETCALRLQVILEESAAAANDFSFPGGTADAGGAAEEGGAEGYGPMAPVSGPHGPQSPRSIGGTNPLSTGTGPSQSLTGILAGANELLGEIGTTQTMTTAALTGTITGAPHSQRSAGFFTGEHPQSMNDRGARAHACMPHPLPLPCCSAPPDLTAAAVLAGDRSGH